MILVTGCTGFVGTHLVNALVDAGFEVRCFARGAESVERLPSGRIDFAVGDVTNRESLTNAMVGVETVIHLVGIIREKGSATFERIHVDGTRNVVEAAKARGVKRIIYQSALGARSDGLTRYETTKWQSEEIVRVSGLEWIIARPSLIIGRSGEFLKTLIDLTKSPVIPVIGSGEYKLQPLYIGDLAQAFIKMLGDPSLWEKTYEFGGPEQLSFNKMIETVREVLGVHKSMFHLPTALMKPAIRLMETILPNPPITSDQLAMLAEDSITDHNAFTEVFGINPIPFKEALKLSLPG